MPAKIQTGDRKQTVLKRIEIRCEANFSSPRVNAGMALLHVSRVIFFFTSYTNDTG